MRNAGLDEAQAGTKVARRNINNFIYTDDTPYGRNQRGTKQPLHESERRELKSCLKTQQSKNEDYGIQSHHIAWPTKFHLVKAMVFPVAMYGCESWIIKKADYQRIDGIEL